MCPDASGLHPSDGGGRYRILSYVVDAGSRLRQDARVDHLAHTDQTMIDQINQRSGVGLELQGRAAAGTLGGAVLARWPDGRQAVVTVFHGGLAAAERVAAAVNELAAAGLPVPRHDLAVDLGGSVALVQERLPSGSPGAFSEVQVDAIWAINERFAGVAAAMAGVPPVRDWFLPAGEGTFDHVWELATRCSSRARAAVGDLVDVAAGSLGLLGGDDVVHVDLNAANVLFDDNGAVTGVVDWNLGIFRGPRELALVQTRFDCEWFVRMASPDPGETAAARYLDRLLAERVDPLKLRAWWAFWLLHWLPKAFNSPESEVVVGWHLDLVDAHVR